MLRELLRRSVERLRTGARFGVAAIAAALLSFFTIAYLARHEPHVVQLCIAGVLIALSLVRADESRDGRVDPVPPWVTWMARFAMIPLVALVGTLLGNVAGDRPALGLALIGIPLVAAVWVRRFGEAWTRLGTLWSFPFIASLVTPAAAVAGDAGGVGWGALAAFIAVAWGSMLGWAVSGRSFRDAAAPLRGDRGAPVRGDRGSRGLRASDRMAIHLALALAVAILVGELLLRDHLVWFVLTAYVVTSGNRGRADVVYKGIQRLAGAAGGALVATLLGTLFGPGDTDALVVLFLLLGVGAVLRVVGYAWWAAAMTGALALLYGFMGQGGADYLGERLLAILIGGAIAIAASAFVLPVRSIDVLRRRVADLLAVAREVLTADRSDPGYGRLAARVDEAVARVAQLAPAQHALRLVTLGRLPRARRGADLLDQAVALGEPLERFVAAPSRELGGLLKARVGSVRESLLALRDD